MRSGFIGRGIGPTAIKRRAAAAPSADWWTVAGQTCVAAYKAIGAADLATSYVNLANPGTYNAAPGTAPGLAAGGWTFNGSSQYLTTGVVPSGNHSVVVRFSSAARSAGSIIGSASSGANLYGIFPYYTDDKTYFQVGSNFVSATFTVNGVLAMAGGKGYLNGATHGSAFTPGDAGTRPLVIGAFDNVGALQYFASTIAAVAIYSTPLSASDVAALTTRMAALT